MSSDAVLVIKKERGKKITVKSFGADVVIMVWRKNDGVLLPLLLNRMGAQTLLKYIKAAITDASGASAESLK
jgi:hypothetical protein